MDLSNNGFNKHECRVIQLALENVRNLIGLHFYGHWGYIDFMGNLILDFHKQNDR